ncbi:putative integral membrane transporter [Streptomyces sp. Tu6071]|nr:putative integral membrane transporter [Streptomyces sp. Tu6071]
MAAGSRAGGGSGRLGEVFVLDRAVPAGQGADDDLRDHEAGHEEDRDAPAARRVVEDADEERAGDGDQVAGALREGGELDDARPGAGAQADHREGEREGAVADADEEGPDPGASGGRERETEVAAESAQAEDDHDGALLRQADRDARDDEGERDAERHGHGEEDTRGPGGDARVAEDLRHPAHGDVGGGGLEPEEAGERPRGAAARDAQGVPGPRRGGVRGALAFSRAALAAQHGPGQYGDGAECRPDREAALPATAERVVERHGDGRGEGGADGEGHRVEPGHRADAVGEPVLDDDRHEHVAHRDAREGERGRGEEARRGPGEGPDDQPGGDRDHAAADHGARAEAPGQARGEGAEDGEAEGRYGGEQPGEGPVHAEPVAHLLQERAEARDGGAQVERGEDDTDRHEDREQALDPGGSRGGSARCGSGGRGGF